MDSTDTARDPALPRLDEVLAAYLDEVDSGQTVDENEWLDRYPTLRDELMAFFRDHRVVKSAVEQSSSGGPSTGSVAKDLPLADPPKHIVGYELIREIGRGGMGIVYEVHQPGLSRNVALKMLRYAEVASSEDLGRLRNEAESIARLNHPAIVAVHDMGSDKGHFWFTMQLIRGNNLAHCADRFQANPRDAVRVVKEVAEAIEHAHLRGILHRDLKPGNIILDDEDQPHVSDFGLARSVDYDGSLTQTGAILGTPSYLAPEQLTNPRGVTTAVDVYGLGAILYCLLTGRPPVVADSIFEAIDKIRNHTIPPPSRLNQSVTKDLDAVCGRCLEKRPEDRYHSAADLAQDLQRVLDGSPVEARTIGNWERINRWRKCNPGVARLAECVIGLTMLLMIGSTTAAVLLGKANREARDSLEEVISAKQELESEKQSALGNLYEARTQQAQAAQSSGRPGQRVDAIMAVQEAATLIGPLNFPKGERLRLRNLQIAAMQLVDLVDDGQRKPGMVSPDGRLRLKADPELRALLITDLESEQLTERLEIDGTGTIDWNRPMWRAFSRQGRYLAARVLDGESGTIQVWQLGQTAPILISDQAESLDGAQVAFSPDDNYVGFVIDGHLDVRRLVDRKEMLILGLPGSVGVSFSYHSNQLAVYGGGRIVILDLLTGEMIREFETVEFLGLAEWTPDDRLLVGRLDNKTPGQNDLHLWNAVSGAYRTLSGHSSHIEFFDVHPRGDMVATFSWDGTLRLWSLDGFDQRLQMNGFFYGFSQDGYRLRVRTNRGGGHWRVEMPQEFRELTPPSVLDSQGESLTKTLRGVAIHPDGRLMVGGNLNALVCWDLASGHAMGGVSQAGEDALFSQDGTRLFTAGPENGEIYVRSVEKEEMDQQIVYVIGPPQRLEVTNEANRGDRIVPEDTTEDHIRDRPSWPAFGTRWRAKRSWGEFFIYDIQGLGLTSFQAAKRQQNIPAVSPDGRWLAVGHWLGPDTHVWDIRDRELVKTFESAQAKVAFSNDGRMLAVNEPGRCTVYEVGSWKSLYRSAEEVSHTVARAVTFSPDSSMLAFDPGSRHEIRLLSTADFQELASMHLPDGPEFVDHIDFSPDSSKLVESSGTIVQLWDLRKIRKELGELDWDLPQLPEPTGNSSKPILVRFQN